MAKVRFMQLDAFYISKYNSDGTIDLVPAWSGYIIVDENNDFEGIANNNSKNDFDRLIYGNLLDMQGILLMKYSGHGYCPCVYSGYSDGNMIWGSLHIIDYDDFVDSFEFAMSIKSYNATYSDIANITSRILAFKENDFEELEMEHYKASYSVFDQSAKKFVDLLKDKASLEKDTGFKIKRIRTTP